MNESYIWFTTGFNHILDWNGYDHILFIMALSVMFSLKDWKPLLMLVTAFTIGHSITLAASVFKLIVINQSIIEILIPLTIILTCAVNIITRNKTTTSVKFNYVLSLLFGFIHGMGFSYLLKSMLGKTANVVLPLFLFNVGLEIGQIIIVLVMLLISAFLVKFTKIKKNDWIFFVSSAVFGIAILLFTERLKF